MLILLDGRLNVKGSPNENFTGELFELYTIGKGSSGQEPVIKELLGSQHFFDSMDASVDNDNFGALIKSPLDLMCGTLNFFEYSLPDFINDAQSFYDKAGHLVIAL